jgi:hypothetical protein
METFNLRKKLLCRHFLFFTFLEYFFSQMHTVHNNAYLVWAAASGIGIGIGTGVGIKT